MLQIKKEDGFPLYIYDENRQIEVSAITKKIVETTWASIDDINYCMEQGFPRNVLLSLWSDQCKALENSPIDRLTIRKGMHYWYVESSISLTKEMTSKSKQKSFLLSLRKLVFKTKNLYWKEYIEDEEDPVVILERKYSNQRKVEEIIQDLTETIEKILLELKWLKYAWEKIPTSTYPKSRDSFTRKVLYPLLFTMGYQKITYNKMNRTGFDLTFEETSKSLETKYYGLKWLTLSSADNPRKLAIEIRSLFERKRRNYPNPISQVICVINRPQEKLLIDQVISSLPFYLHGVIEIWDQQKIKQLLDKYCKK